MAYGLGDNASGSNNTPLGARRRLTVKTDQPLSDTGASERPEAKMEQIENQMELVGGQMEQIDTYMEHPEDLMEVSVLPDSDSLAALIDESDSEPRFKRGRSTQRG